MTPMNNTFKETMAKRTRRSTPRRCSLHGTHPAVSAHRHRRSAQDSPILAFSPSSCRAHGGRPFRAPPIRCMAEHLWTRRREGLRLRESRRRTPTSREGKLAFSCRNWWGSTPLVGLLGSKKAGSSAVLLSPWVVHADGFLCTRVGAAGCSSRTKEERGECHP